MPHKNHTPGCGLDQDPYELGAAGMPYTTQGDYLPLPANAMSTVVGRDRIKKGYDTQQIGDGISYVTNLLPHPRIATGMGRAFQDGD